VNSVTAIFSISRKARKERKDVSCCCEAALFLKRVRNREKACGAHNLFALFASFAREILHPLKVEIK
jgi:hypothetical protein